ncbi:MAG: hypothetical protein QOI74_3858 [Micromonosporaceae bacterium]|jgi:hypothetical protein|nr:hypothetical protein [Micromonosporaceae bacterium]MDT5038619.1 hypothetical protein [Micromonosporaceae bacterium]
MRIKRNAPGCVATAVAAGALLIGSLGAVSTSARISAPSSATFSAVAHTATTSPADNSTPDTHHDI